MTGDADDLALKRLMQEAFPAEADPRDAALARLIAASGPAPSWADRARALLARTFEPRVAVAWGGLAAAAFVAGVLVAPMTQPQGFVVAPDGKVGDGDLVRVLETRLAGQGADADGRAVGLTFRDGDGRWCRTFRAADDGVAGLACREGDGWSLAALAPAPAAGPEVRTAAVDMPQVVLDAVDARIAGTTLDAGAEQRARDGGWR